GILSGLCDAVGTPFSSCSMALYGVSWVWGGMVANNSRPKRSTACYRIGAIAHSLPWQCSARELVSASLPASAISLCGFELRAVSKHGMHDDGKPACQGDARLAHG